MVLRPMSVDEIEKNYRAAFFRLQAARDAAGLGPHDLIRGRDPTQRPAMRALVSFRNWERRLEAARAEPYQRALALEEHAQP